jgi:hypothetical protein
VSPSGFSFLPNSRTPNPSANTTLPSCTRPMDTPGTPSSFVVLSTQVVSCAMRAASSRFAFLPANDSRA